MDGFLKMQLLDIGFEVREPSWSCCQHTSLVPSRLFGTAAAVSCVLIPDVYRLLHAISSAQWLAGFVIARCLDCWELLLGLRMHHSPLRAETIIKSTRVL